MLYKKINVFEILGKGHVDNYPNVDYCIVTKRPELHVPLGVFFY